MELQQSAFVPDPTAGLLILGRKRPGFDPEWGAAVTRRIRAYLEELPWPVHVPAESITDDRELRAALDSCRAAGVTTLILVQPTISDGRLAPMLSRLWNKPLVLWATTEKQTGPMISANSLVGTHVMAATLRQLGHPLEFVYGDPDEGETRARLEQAIVAAHAADAVTGRLYGLVGYHAPGFVDFHADPVFLSDTLDSQLHHMSTPELIALTEGFSEEEIAGDLQALRALDIPWGENLPEAGLSRDGTAELTMQARYYRAFRTLFTREGLDALAFRCWPDLPTVTGHWPYLALAKLLSEGYPIAMEGDVDGAICTRIAESLGVGPVYLTDWLEHTRNTATIWHTGAAPFQLCLPAGSPGGLRLGVQFNNRKPTVVEATIRAGLAVTLFRLWRYDGTYHMTALEGDTVEPKRDLMATNGLFATDRVDLYEWFEEMVQVGMPHHLCVVEGHHGDTLQRVARLIGAEVV
ncbi:MAG: sugar isomerase [Spirochaetaceae bacterium]|nr:MAG: sugar isomerase [Spirochaetaceae bacterium]